MTKEEKEIKRRKAVIEDELKRLMKNIDFCPEPAYSFQIGDKVHLGNLIDVTITEILENGKIYKILYSYKENNYGNPYIVNGLERYLYWFKLRPISTAKESLIQNDDFKIYFTNSSISDLLGKKYEFGTDMNPDYQRDYVWSDEDKVALIDSIFSNIDIGKFVFVHNDYTSKYLYEILDGKQRMNAILEFYENRFAYKGKYFNDLCYLDQNHFLNYSIQEASIPHNDKKTILKYFLLLNRSGKRMDEQHLAKVDDIFRKMEETE